MLRTALRWMFQGRVSPIEMGAFAFVYAHILGGNPVEATLEDWGMAWMLLCAWFFFHELVNSFTEEEKQQ